MKTKVGFAEVFCMMVILLCFGFFFWVTELTMHGEKVGSEISEIKICIIGIAGSIVGYVIGSSKSSADKNEAINKALEKPTVINNAPSASNQNTTQNNETNQNQNI